MENWMCSFVGIEDVGFIVDTHYIRIRLALNTEKEKLL